MRIHLVDGTYELFRAHFGAPPRSDPQGRPVGATVGLLRSLLLLLSTPDVTHVAVAFDHVVESFRNELFAGYKTSAGMPAELLAQFPLAEQAAAELGLVVWSMIEFEADDALATGARRYAGAPGVDQVVICSPDKDLAQAVEGGRVVCWDRRREVVLDEDGVRAKFGVGPASIPDYLSLVGDAADGLPGVPGWGAKSAAAVLARFPHLEAIPDEPRDLGLPAGRAARLAESLATHRDDALLYRRLATLRRDVPLRQGVGDLEWRGPAAGLGALCKELGDEWPARRAAALRDASRGQAR